MVLTLLIILLHPPPNKNNHAINVKPELSYEEIQKYVRKKNLGQVN